MRINQVEAVRIGSETWRVQIWTHEAVYTAEIVATSEEDAETHARSMFVDDRCRFDRAEYDSDR